MGPPWKEGEIRLEVDKSLEICLNHFFAATTAAEAGVVEDVSTVLIEEYDPTFISTLQQVHIYFHHLWQKAGPFAFIQNFV